MALIELYGTETDLIGGEEDDLLIFAPNVTSVNGGPGIDIIDLSAVAAPVIVDLDLETIMSFANTLGINAVDVEGVIGTDFNDELYGNDEDNYFQGLGGDDIIDGRGGSNTVSYLTVGPHEILAENIAGQFLTAESVNIDYAGIITGSGAADEAVTNNAQPDGPINFIMHVNHIDLVAGTAAGPTIGSDSISNVHNVIGSNDSDYILGDDGDNILYGSDGDDHIVGGAGNDIIDGGFHDPALQADGSGFGGLPTGNDLIEAGDGDDRIIYSRDNTGSTDIDTVYGGDGIDTFVMSTIFFTNRSIDLFNNVYNFGTLDSVIATRGFIFEVENVEVIGGVQVRGDDGANHISASGIAGDNVFEGMGGDDVLLSHDGNDSVDGGSGNDYIEGGNGFDLLRGGDDNDTIFGQADGDTIYGDLGDDILWGGDGDDTIFGGTGDAGMVNFFGFGMGSGSVVRAPAAGNDAIGTAIDISGDFALSANPDIENAAVWPHVSISGVADGGDTHFYAFTVTEDTVIQFDVDYAAGGTGFFDAWLNFYDSVGTLIFSSDDSGTDPGSTSTLDSQVALLFGPGTYYVEIGIFFGGGDLPVGGDYELQRR